MRVDRQFAYCAVSVKFATGCPKAYGPSAVTLTVPEAEGSVRVTLATPDELVTMLCRVTPPKLPSSVENRTLAPEAVPPDEPGLRVTDSVMLEPAGAV